MKIKDVANFLFAAGVILTAASEALRQYDLLVLNPGQKEPDSDKEEEK